MSERLTIPFPFIAKGERRSGGVEVAFIENNRQLEEFTHKQNHKFLIQENIIGNELNADAFYRNGKLIFVAFSSTKFAMWKFGPFARRDYARKIPNEVSENLQLIGEKLQFNGIANVTFMKDSKNKNLKLFEFDARLNVWAHVSILFGFDPQEFYRNSTAMNFTNPMGKVFVNRPRFNKYLDDTYGNRVTLKRLHLLKTKIRVFISGGSFTD